KRAYCLKTQPATGETYPKSDLFNKALFTLQEGVSQTQHKEMKDAGVKLVVPSSLHRKYPEAVRGELMTLGAFIAELTGLYAELP
uniref:type II restriction endonuclease n=1 Tax=Enterobacter kobei TaxID=208224 RepID=UPI00298C7B47